MQLGLGMNRAAPENSTRAYKMNAAWAIHRRKREADAREVEGIWYESKGKETHNSFVDRAIIKFSLYGPLTREERQRGTPKGINRILNNQ
jgi:hypothetical protein